MNISASFFSPLYAVTLNTFLRLIRARIYYAVLFYAVLIVVVALAGRNLAIAGKDVLFTFTRLYVSYLGMLAAVMFGVVLVYEEVNSGTSQIALSKPLSRPAFLLGKYLGLVSAILVCIAGIMLIYSAACIVGGKGLEGQAFRAMFLTSLKLSVISGVAVFFSSFARPVPAAIFSLSIAMLGNVAGKLKSAAAGIETAGLKQAVQVVVWVIPDFQFFSLRGEAFFRMPVFGGRVSLSLLYALLYIIVCYALSVIIFSRRDVG